MTSAGLYVHVPFCERVCPYCDFAVVAASRIEPDVEARYTDALVRELEARGPAFARGPLETIYFGGGTPSLFSAEALERVIDAARRLFSVADPSALEITLEANPSTTERERLVAFREAGINRLSLGIQSFDDTTLRRLGRAHKAEDSRAMLAAAREAGFASISLDLILACPGQSFDAFARDLDEALAFAPEHLSIYELTIEEGTPFALAEARDQLARADEDDATRMLVHTAERCREVGLERYEVSNYAKPGHGSRHNQRYWAREPVLGLGMGAWSYEPSGTRHPHGARRMNPRALDAWLQGALTGDERDVEVDALSLEQARGEAVFLSLRRSRGLDAAAFEREFAGPPRQFYGEAIDRLLAASLLTETPTGDLRLTEQGVLLSDTVFADFV